MGLKVELTRLAAVVVPTDSPTRMVLTLPPVSDIFAATQP